MYVATIRFTPRVLTPQQGQEKLKEITSHLDGNFQEAPCQGAYKTYSKLGDNGASLFDGCLGETCKICNGTGKIKIAIGSSWQKIEIPGVNVFDTPPERLYDALTDQDWELDHVNMSFIKKAKSMKELRDIHRVFFDWRTQELAVLSLPPDYVDWLNRVTFQSAEDITDGEYV